MQNLIAPDFLVRLRVGSVAPFIDLYLNRIEQQGFLPSSVPMQMYAIARFGKWIDHNNIGLLDLDERVVERFLKRDRDVARSSEPAPLRRFVGMLREIGITATKRSEPRNQRQTCMSDYRHYLLKERGLAESTIPSYVAFADQFLADRFGDSDLNLIALAPGDVATFMRKRAHGLTRETAKLMVTGLRSFFRYLRTREKSRPIWRHRCFQWQAGRFPMYRSSCRPERWNGCLTPANAARRKENETMQFCCSWRVWVCAPARSLR
jgi:hypothetical protein